MNLLNIYQNMCSNPWAPPVVLLVICAPFTIGNPPECEDSKYRQDQGLQALAHLKDWSNYLLVTTVALLGWIATNEAYEWQIAALKPWCLWSFALSLIFGIFTLALIPLVAEIYEGGKSIYKVRPNFEILGWRWSTNRFRIKHACRPQHLLFIAGVLFLVVGSMKP